MAENAPAQGRSDGDLRLMLDDLNRRVFLLERALATAPEQRHAITANFVDTVHGRLAGADFRDAEEGREFLRASTRALEQATAALDAGAVVG